MTPFYHPTSILVLDDDPLFLESLDFQFSEEVSCQTFTRPDAALQHLAAQASQHPSFPRYFKDASELDARTDPRVGDRLLRLQLSELRAVIDDPAREQRVAVAVVDYDMPKMTGVEFCRAIRHLPVKTILLTGKAGLETAIAAFNEGVINCFLQKQDASVTLALRREIRRLQEEYFEEISAPISNALALEEPSFFADPGFISLLREVMDENQIVEHYVSATPPGVMMRDADGNELFLLVSHGESLDAQYATAERRNAPADMLQLLRARKAHGWFPTEDGHYHPDFEKNWSTFVRSAEPLPGSECWSYSLIRHEALPEEAFYRQRA
ncbi:MAG TPA: response regulator [Hyphomicrobium sp.]|nr:response regulator [Hyphomicrobium sp.]